MNISHLNQEIHQDNFLNQFRKNSIEMVTSCDTYNLKIAFLVDITNGKQI